MYEEELTFVFFTTKQFIILILGLLATFATYINMSEYAWAGGAIWLSITLGLVFKFKPKKVENAEEYLKTHPERREKVLKQLYKHVKNMEKKAEYLRSRGIDDTTINTGIQNLHEACRRIKQM